MGKMVSENTNLVKGKLPPQAVDLEQVVLGAMLIDTKGLDDALEFIQNDDVFYQEDHKLIFQAMKTLHSKSISVDILTVAQELKKMKKIESVGGELYLIQLTQMVSSGANTEHHCAIITEKYLKRTLIKMAGLVIEQSYDEALDTFDVIDSAEREFTHISELLSRGRQSMSWADSLREVANRVEFLTKNEGDLTGVTTGLRKLDKHFGGWQPTDFIVIGARPGMGKTAFTINNMIAAAKSGVAVGFMSMEMSDIQLATRSVAVSSSFHMRQLNQTGFEKQQYFTTLNNLINEIESLPIYIDDRPSLSIGDIKRKARSWKRKYNIGLLIVDYIQLAGGHSDIRIRTGETSRGLKHIAKELMIPVIGLSQLSRSVETSGGAKRPALHHLKEAGDIEQDADIVSFLYRPRYYGFDCDPQILDVDENTEFITAKNRSGALGTSGIWFEENKTKFMDEMPMSTILF